VVFVWQLEAQFKLGSYDPILDLLGDYAYIAIGYGERVAYCADL
jgi:hypothetical protein